MIENNNPDNKQRFRKTIEELSKKESYDMVYMPRHEKLMPSVNRLGELVDTLRRILFPGYFGDSSLNPETVSYYLGVNMDRAYHLLAEQIRRGICYDCSGVGVKSCVNCSEEAEATNIATEFISRLPKLRNLLSTDVKAAYDGDPAAKNYGEVIFCYPTIRVLTNHRIAHELLQLGVPLIPRIISEMAHSETGIDIHPGAEIGNFFTIDHGTGVVIGETCRIGNHVKIYQGVTLGAKSFPLDDNGNPIKGIPRHPIVEDNVIIYAGATILGRITIGAKSVIGGNVWVTNSIPQATTVLQPRSRDTKFIHGAGI